MPGLNPRICTNLKLELQHSQLSLAARLAATEAIESSLCSQLLVPLGTRRRPVP